MRREREEKGREREGERARERERAREKHQGQGERREREKMAWSHILHFYKRYGRRSLANCQTHEISHKEDEKDPYRKTNKRNSVGQLVRHVRFVYFTLLLFVSLGNTCAFAFLALALKHTALQPP